MNTKIDALRDRARKANDRARELMRKAQKAEKHAAEIERNADTRRKIIDGAHIQTEALNNPDIAALLQRMREEKLILDHDRSLFGLTLLSEEEKDRRMAESGRERRRRTAQAAAKSDADARRMEVA